MQMMVGQGDVKYQCRYQSIAAEVEQLNTCHNLRSLRTVLAAREKAAHTKRVCTAQNAMSSCALMQIETVFSCFTKSNIKD